MPPRYHFKQTDTLEKRLIDYSKALFEEARLLPLGALREATILKARQAKTGSEINEWLLSPGLRPPE
jgi:hypothetical protein